MHRQYYGYPGAEGGGGTGGGGAGPGAGVVEYQSPPQPGEYPAMLPYYGAYPPPPPPLPPPPNPAYLHAQGRPIVDREYIRFLIDCSLEPAVKSPINKSLSRE